MLICELIQFVKQHTNNENYYQLVMSDRRLCSNLSVNVIFENKQCDKNNDFPCGVKETETILG